jgi:hypothetical protein
MTAAELVLQLIFAALLILLVLMVLALPAALLQFSTTSPTLPVTCSLATLVTERSQVGLYLQPMLLQLSEIRLVVLLLLNPASFETLSAGVLLLHRALLYRVFLHWPRLGQVAAQSQTTGPANQGPCTASQPG